MKSFHELKKSRVIFSAEIAAAIPITIEEQQISYAICMRMQKKKKNWKSKRNCDGFRLSEIHSSRKRSNAVVGGAMHANEEQRKERKKNTDFQFRRFYFVLFCFFLRAIVLWYLDLYARIYLIEETIDFVFFFILLKLPFSISVRNFIIKLM